MKRGLRTLDTFENNFGLNHKFAEYLKESYDMDLDQHFFFKYFVKIPFVKVISPKQSGSAERKRHDSQGAKLNGLNYFIPQVQRMNVVK